MLELQQLEREHLRRSSISLPKTILPLATSGIPRWPGRVPMTETIHPIEKKKTSSLRALSLTGAESLTLRY